MGRGVFTRRQLDLDHAQEEETAFGKAHGDLEE